MKKNQPASKVAKHVAGTVSGKNGMSFKPPPVQFKTHSPVASLMTQTVQRYISNDLGGAIDNDTYNARANEFDRGGTGFGEANKAWAEVTDPEFGARRIIRESAYGQGHSEELLLDEIRNTYGDILRNDPANGRLRRITAIYTERRPCGAANEEVGYPRNRRNDNSCHAMLTRRLHANVPVYFSVANSSNAHNRLMNDERNRYIAEIVNNTRQITAQNMRARNGRLYIQGDIQRLSAQHNPRNYGRNYEADYRILQDARQRVSDAHHDCDQESAMPMPQDLQLNLLLNALDARYTGAHQFGSDPVQQAIVQRRDAFLLSLQNCRRMRRINERREILMNLVHRNYEAIMELGGENQHRNTYYGWIQELVGAVNRVTENDLQEQFPEVRAYFSLQEQVLFQRVRNHARELEDELIEMEGSDDEENDNGFDPENAPNYQDFYGQMNDEELEQDAIDQEERRDWWRQNYFDDEY